MIEAKNLYFRYGEKFVLNNVNLSIKEGSFTAIIGANGSGKTTLAKHFNALLTPTKGDVFVDGSNTKKNDIDARKKVGFVFQNFEDQLIHSIVEEDIAFGLENLELSSKEIVQRVKSTLKMTNIEKLAKANVNMLSFGQKQLVALAGVLSMNPKYIVFDEPTTMLDIKNKNNVMSIIKTLKQNNGIAVVLITNVIDDLEYSDNVIALKKGRVVFNGKINDKHPKLKAEILKKAGLND